MILRKKYIRLDKIKQEATMRKKEEIEKLLESYPVNLTVQQTAEILNVTYRTCGDWVRAGVIPAKNLTPEAEYAKYRILKSDLINYLLNGETNE